MKTTSLKWYLNRLKAMEPAEIMSRVTFVIRKKVWSFSLPRIKENPDLHHLKFFNDFVEILEPVLKQEKGKIIHEANRYLEHHWLFFDFEKQELDIDWHFDPQYEKRAPTTFSFSINHRLEELVGNIKNTWEKNRHHHLCILASAFYLTRDEKYALEVRNQLISWVDQNKFLQGVNWTHPLEQGIRLISWVYIYHLLSSSKHFNELFGSQGILWKPILEHQKFIVWTYSKGSSANNHLIGEMAGLFIASNVWPVYRKSKEWIELSKYILINELARQTDADGVNKELAYSYQFFVLEFEILSLFFGQNKFPEDFKKTLTKKMEFIDSLNLILSYPPNYGDGDEGMALQVLPLKVDRLKWINPLFDHLDLKTANSNTEYALYEDAGLFASKWGLVNSSVMRLLFDFGPLGMGSMAAHGHADALNFTLTYDENPILIDPGTFCYHDDLQFRAYFRSTLAHNTISINGRDQSKQVGPFLWTEHANAMLENFNIDNQLFDITASHNGYLRDFGVIHKRRLVNSNCGLSIEDTISGEGDKLVTLSFHFHPEINVEKKGHEVFMSIENVSLKMKTQENLSFEINKGSISSGWYSPYFGTKQITSSLVMTQVLSLPTKIFTEIVID